MGYWWGKGLQITDQDRELQAAIDRELVKPENHVCACGCGARLETWPGGLPLTEDAENVHCAMVYWQWSFLPPRDGPTYEDATYMRQTGRWIIRQTCVARLCPHPLKVRIGCEGRRFLEESLRCDLAWKCEAWAGGIPACDQHPAPLNLYSQGTVARSVGAGGVGVLIFGFPVGTIDPKNPLPPRGWEEPIGNIRPRFLSGGHRTYREAFEENVE